MSKPKPARRCGTCAHYKRQGPGYGLCRAPYEVPVLPLSAWVETELVNIDWHERCPRWADKQAAKAGEPS